MVVPDDQAWFRRIRKRENFGAAQDRGGEEEAPGLRNIRKCVPNPTRLWAINVSTRFGGITMRSAQYEKRICESIRQRKRFHGYADGGSGSINTDRRAPFLT